MKTCPACGTTETRSPFYASSTLCKACHNATSRKRHAERTTSDPEYRARRLLYEIRKRCERAGVPFDLDAQWVMEKRDAGRCEVTGIPFDGLCADAIYSRPWGFSIDRERPELGYTKDNCKAVVWLYNRAKGPGAAADVLRMAEALVRRGDMQ